MAFREKGAWITLATTVLVYTVYFGAAWVPLASSARGGGPLGPLIVAVPAIIVLQAALRTMVAATNPKDARAPLDERARWIELRSTGAGYYTLLVGVFLTITTLFWGADAGLILNAVLFAIVVGEVVRSGWQVFEYRRTAA